MKIATLTLLGFGALLLALLVVASATAPESDSARRIDLRCLRFELKYISTEAGAIASYEAGDGQPLVFLHEIYPGASSFTSWRKIAPAFFNKGKRCPEPT